MLSFTADLVPIRSVLRTPSRSDTFALPANLYTWHCIATCSVYIPAIRGLDLCNTRTWIFARRSKALTNWINKIIASSGIRQYLTEVEVTFVQKEQTLTVRLMLTLFSARCLPTTEALPSLCDLSDYHIIDAALHANVTPNLTQCRGMVWLR